MEEILELVLESWRCKKWNSQNLWTIYIEMGKMSGRVLAQIPIKFPHYRISITPKNVVDRASYEVNAEASRMPKHQKCAPLQLKRHLHRKKRHKSGKDNCQKIKIPLFSKLQKSGILRGYCKEEGPRYRYWAVGHVRECQIAWGQVNTNEGIPVNGPWKKYGHKELEMLSKEKYLLG